MQIKSIESGKRYGNLWAIRQITLTLPIGSPLLLLGPSGGGKSTLLRLLAGLEIADEGSIQVDGIPLPPHEPTLRDYRRHRQQHHLDHRCQEHFRHYFLDLAFQLHLVLSLRDHQTHYRRLLNRRVEEHHHLNCRRYLRPCHHL